MAYFANDRAILNRLIPDEATVVLGAAETQGEMNWEIKQ